MTICSWLVEREISNVLLQKAHLHQAEENVTPEQQKRLFENAEMVVVYVWSEISQVRPVPPYQKMSTSIAKTYSEMKCCVSQR